MADRADRVGERGSQDTQGGGARGAPRWRVVLQP